MKICALIWVIFLVLFCRIAQVEASSDSHFTAKSKPIAIRNQMPLYLFYLQMAPDKTDVIERDKFLVDAGYTVSNVTVSGFTPATSLYDVQIDMEVSRVTIDLRYGVCENFEMGVEIPYLSLSSGYLDNIIENVEDGIGARTPRSRERQGSYEFDYSLKYNGNYLIQKKHSLQGIGDMVFNAKYQTLKEENRLMPNMSLRTAIKFPTADKDDLLGSGKIDYGAGLLLDKRVFDRAFIYLGANVVRIDKPSFFSELGLDNEIYSGAAALEYFFTERFSIITQVSGNTTPYSSSGTNALDNDAYEMGVGFNYMFKEKSSVSWHFALVENVVSASSPDVSAHTSLSWEF